MKIKNDEQNQKFSYIKAGLTAFLVIAAVILFFFIVFKLDAIAGFCVKIVNILQPVIMGAVIAFLIKPITNYLENNIFLLLNKIFKKQGKFKKFSRYSAISLSLILFVLLISVFFYMVIPEFAKTLTNLISVLPGQIKSFSVWLINLMQSNLTVSEILNNIFTSFQNWFQENFVSNATVYATYLATGVIDVVSFVLDFLIGLVVAFYVLSSKNTLKLQLKKILYAIFDKKTTHKIIDVLKKSDAIFSGFINGKLINALIIGLLCFIGCSIMGIPYVMLISVVIAVTDMIPVFGPYIGAVPCALLILLYSPIKCLYFIIYIILLQVFDGNVIGPKILGESTGLSAFWVMVSILLGGGLFGIIGMLIGVPVFAVFYYLLKTLINYLLNRKNLPVEAYAYNGAGFENNSTVIEGEEDEQKSTDKAE